GPVTPRLVQMGLGLLNCVLAFVMGRKWHGGAVGLFWAGFMAFYWAFIYFEGELHATTLQITLLLIIVYLLGLWAERFHPAYALAAGGLMGLSALVRPDTLPILGAVSLWMLWVASRRGAFRRGAVAALALMLCTFAGIAPATLRNYVVAHDLVPICANDGINLFIGNNEFATGRPAATIPGVGRFANCYDYPALVATLETKLGRPLKHSEVSAYFREQALDYIKGHPLKWLRLIGTKALLFWGPWEIANNKEDYYERAFSRVLSRLPGNFPAVLALAASGGVILFLHLRRRRPATGCEADVWERRREWSLLVVFVIAAQFVSVLPFFVCARYRVPVVSFLLLLAAYGMGCGIRFLAARRWVAAAGWVLGSTAAYAGFSVPLVPGGPDLFRWYYDRGAAYHRLGQFDRALEYYEECLRIAPDVPLARLGAARLLFYKGRFDEAAEHLRYILRYVHFYQAEAHHLLAQVLVQQGQMEQAVTHYGEALRLQPADGQVHLEFGHLLRELGRGQEAAYQYQLLLTNEPQHAEALVGLGLALRDLGRMEESDRRLLEAVQLEPGWREWLKARGLELGTDLSEGALAVAAEEQRPSADELARRADQYAAAGRTYPAIQLYQEALALEPHHPLLPYKLAETLVTVNRFEEARKYYEQALAANPEFAAAHIGLGMVYARLDDVEAAVRHYREAVRIDPDSLAAHYNLGIALGDGLGHYAEGLEVLTQALVLCRSIGRTDLEERISDRIGRFREKLPGPQSGGSP
ncbi:MAG: tetratricopeptide repeat protein, partial [Planctomycetota bacterium]